MVPAVREAADTTEDRVDVSGITGTNNKPESRIQNEPSYTPTLAAGGSNGFKYRTLPEAGTDPGSFPPRNLLPMRNTSN